MVNCLRKRKVTKPCILLSGILPEDRIKFELIVKRLGAKLSQLFSRSCTHIICGKPCKSEKFLTGCATGKWILTPAYIIACHKADRWLPEEEFEYHVTADVQDKLLLQMLEAPGRWRRVVFENHSFAFSGWNAAVLIGNKKKKDTYTRLLNYGGAGMYKVKLPIRNCLTVANYLTYIFVDHNYIDEVSCLINYGVLCLIPEYIGDFLIMYPPPDIFEYVYKMEQSPATCLKTSIESHVLTAPHPKTPLAPAKKYKSKLVRSSSAVSEQGSEKCRNPYESFDASEQQLSECQAIDENSVPTKSRVGQKRKVPSNDALHYVMRSRKFRRIMVDANTWHPATFPVGILNFKEREGCNLALSPTALSDTVTNVIHSCFEEGCHMKALDLILTYLSTAHYLQPCTLHLIMIECLRNSANLQIMHSAYWILQCNLTMHPPTTPKLQHIYQLSFCNGKNEVLFSEWKLFKDVITQLTSLSSSGKDQTEEDSKMEANLLLLRYLVSVMECNFQDYITKHSKKTAADSGHPPCMIMLMLWGSHPVSGLNKNCHELIFYLNQIATLELSETRKMDFMGLIVSLISMLGEILKMSDPVPTNTLSFHLRMLDVKWLLYFIHELANGLINIHDITWLQFIMKQLSPSWICLAVCCVCLDSLYSVLYPYSSKPVEHINLGFLLKRYLPILLHMTSEETSEDGTTTQEKSNAVKPQSLFPLENRESDTNQALSQVNQNVYRVQGLTLPENQDGSGSKSFLMQPRKQLVAADHKKKFKKGESLLHLACIKNNVKMLRKLLKVPEVDVNVRDKTGKTPLHEACNRGHGDCILELLKFQPRKTITSYFRKGYLDCSQIDLLASTVDGITPLHGAVLNNQVESVHILLQNAGSILLKSKTKYGFDAMELASTEEMLSVLQSYSEDTADVSADLNTPFVSRDSPLSAGTPTKALPPQGSSEVSLTKQQFGQYICFVHHLIQSYMETTKLHKLIQYARLKESLGFDKSWLISHNRQILPECYTELLMKDIKTVAKLMDYLPYLEKRFGENQLVMSLQALRD